MRARGRRSPLMACSRGISRSTCRREAGDGEGPGYRRLLFFFLDLHGFDVLGFEDLTAVQTFQVVHPVSSGDDLGACVLAGLHMQRLDEIYSSWRIGYVKPHLVLGFYFGWPGAARYNPG